MGIFSKPEIIILKESNSAEEHLAKLEELLPRATGKVKENIQKEIILTKAGIDGEKKVLYELKNSNMDLVVLQDICIRAKDGREAQIDFVIVTSKLMILLECKNLVGNIEIDSKGNFIRTIQYGKRYWKEGIYSPITQNERHMEVLKECKSEEWNAVMGAMVRMSFSSFHKSLVVLANEKTYLNDRYAKKEVKEQVIRADQLIATIRRMNAESKFPKSTKKEMLGFGEKMLERDTGERKDYAARYEELIDLVEAEELEVTEKEEAAVDAKTVVAESVAGEQKAMTQIEEEPAMMNPTILEEVQMEIPATTGKIICPVCGGELVLRTARRGANTGKQFYGCSSFPRCRYILNIAENLEKSDTSHSKK